MQPSMSDVKALVASSGQSGLPLARAVRGRNRAVVGLSTSTALGVSCDRLRLGPDSLMGLMLLTSGNRACIMKNVVNEPAAVISVLLAPAGATATARVVPHPASTTAPARIPFLKIVPLYFTFAPS